MALVQKLENIREETEFNPPNSLTYFSSQNTWEEGVFDSELEVGQQSTHPLGLKTNMLAENPDAEKGVIRLSTDASFITIRPMLASAGTFFIAMEATIHQPDSWFEFSSNFAGSDPMTSFQDEFWIYQAPIVVSGSDPFEFTITLGSDGSGPTEFWEMFAMGWQAT